MSRYKNFIASKYVQNVKWGARLFVSVTFCDRIVFFSVAETLFFCDRKLFLSQKLISVKENYFCDGNFFLWQNFSFFARLFFFYDRKLFLYQNLNSVKFFFLREKWEFLLSCIMEIITLWSPGPWRFECAILPKHSVKCQFKSKRLLHRELELLVIM